MKRTSQDDPESAHYAQPVRSVRLAQNVDDERGAKARLYSATSPSRRDSLIAA